LLLPKPLKRIFYEAPQAPFCLSLSCKREKSATS
jgi:hypothetical protein